MIASVPNIAWIAQHFFTTVFSSVGFLYMNMLHSEQIFCDIILLSSVVVPTVHWNLSFALSMKFIMYGVHAIIPAVFIVPTIIAEAIMAPVMYVPLFPMNVFAG